MTEQEENGPRITELDNNNNNDIGNPPSTTDSVAQKPAYDHTCESIYCIKPGEHHCENCQSVYYCSREHQKADWKTHRAWCKRVEGSSATRVLAVDGYRLCDAVLKANDVVQIALTNKHFECVERVSETELVVISKEEEPEELEPVVEEVADDYQPPELGGGIDIGGNGPDTIPQKHRRYRLVRTATDYGNLNNSDSIRSYWAYRSSNSTFLLNTTLYYLLKAYVEKGYKSVIFGKTVVPLVTEGEGALQMRCILLEPHMRVHIGKRWEGATSDASKEVALMCVSVGGYSFDLSAGRFWLFDEFHQLRPLFFAPNKEFIKKLGRFVQDYKPKAVLMQMERMYTSNIDNVVQGASVCKLAMLHLGLLLDHNCPQRFRGTEIRTQQQHLAGLFLVTDQRFQTLVEQYLAKGDSRLAQTVNVLAHCAEEVALHGVPEVNTNNNDIVCSTPTTETTTVVVSTDQETKDQI